MTTKFAAGPFFGLMLVLSVGACQNTGPTPYPANPDVAQTRTTHPQYGVVKSIERVPPENHGIAGSNIGLGAVAGAVVGGIVGNQFGAGTGNTAATVAGAAGGAYVGHQLEKRQQTDAYKVTIRLNDGASQALVYETDPGFRVGDRVRLENGAAQRY